MKNFMRRFWWVPWTGLYLVAGLSVAFGMAPGVQKDQTEILIQIIWLAPLGAWSFYLAWKGRDRHGKSN